MSDIINFLNANKELFSGIGTEVVGGVIAVIGGIIIWLLKKNNTKPNLVQVVGDNSVALQSGCDITINELDIGDKKNAR